MSKLEFWETNEFKDAHLTKVNYEPSIMEPLLEWVKKPAGMLILCGNPGTGKTYFAAAFMNYLNEKKIKDKRGHDEKRFFSMVRDVIDQGWDYEREVARLCESHYFILNDIFSGKNYPTDFQKECLFSFVDNRWMNNLPTIITSNIFIKDMQMHPRFMSRLNDKRNIVINLNGQDKRQE